MARYPPSLESPAPLLRFYHNLSEVVAVEAAVAAAVVAAQKAAAAGAIYSGSSSTHLPRAESLAAASTADGTGRVVSCSEMDPVISLGVPV